MKSVLNVLLFVFIIAMLSCDDTTGGNDELMLNITRADWSMSWAEGLGTVDLEIGGSTTGAQVSILTHGDGDDQLACLDLGADGTFDETVSIAFTVYLESEVGEYGTEVTAYADADPSLDPVFGCSGSGATKTIKLESGLLPVDCGDSEETCN